MQVTQCANMPKVGDNPIENALFTARNVVEPSIPHCRNLCFMDIPGLCTEPFSFALQSCQQILHTVSYSSKMILSN